jgi:hypothetical protein
MTSKLATAPLRKRLKESFYLYKKGFLREKKKIYLKEAEANDEQVNELAGPECFYVRKSSVQK